jgi:hypothetical protein
MLSSMLPNAICCATCFPTHDTVQHAAQITAQLAGQHNILPIMPPTQHTANCRQTIFPACDPTKYAAQHPAQQNMLSNKTCSLPNIACCTTCCTTYLPILPPWVVMGNLLYFCKYSANKSIPA